MRTGAFKVHNERNDELCLEKQEVLEGVGPTQEPENRSLWFEQPWAWPLLSHPLCLWGLQLDHQLT